MHRHAKFHLSGFVSLVFVCLFVATLSAQPSAVLDGLRGNWIQEVPAEREVEILELVPAREERTEEQPADDPPAEEEPEVILEVREVEEREDGTGEVLVDETRDLEGTKLIIDREGDVYTVHVLAPCALTACDWGKVNARAEGAALFANFSFLSISMDVEISPLDDGRLSVLHNFTDPESGVSREFTMTYQRAPDFSFLQGEWVREAPELGGLSRFTLEQPSFTYFANAFEPCLPAECDWGTATVAVGHRTLTAVFGSRGPKKQLRIMAVSPDRLLVEVTTFADRDLAGDSNAFYFVRSVGIDHLVGEWVGADPEHGLPRILVERTGDEFSVHGFGRCHPEDCDWGVTPAARVADYFYAQYDHGFKTNTIIITLDPDGRLHVWSLNVFSDGTDRDYFTEYFFVRPERPAPRFERGDANSNGVVDIADPVLALNFLFGGTETPTCLKANDTNDDGTLNLADPVSLLNFLFGGGPPPSAPFGRCGFDPNDDLLSCELTACAS